MVLPLFVWVIVLKFIFFLNNCFMVIPARFGIEPFLLYDFLIVFEVGNPIFVILKLNYEKIRIK